MNIKFNKSMQARIEALPQNYHDLLIEIAEGMDDKYYDQNEARYHIQKTLTMMEKATAQHIEFDHFVSHNAKKFKIARLQLFKKHHITYIQRSKSVSKITNLCLLSLVLYSFFMIALNAYYTEYLIYLWIPGILGILTALCLLYKIPMCKRLHLPAMYLYSDIIMYLLITIISMMTTYYFMLFLWIYDIGYMIYLQRFVVYQIHD